MYTFADTYEAFVAGYKAALAKSSNAELEYIMDHMNAFASRFEVCEIYAYDTISSLNHCNAACEAGVRLAEEYPHRAEARARSSSTEDIGRKEGSQRRVKLRLCFL